MRHIKHGLLLVVALFAVSALSAAAAYATPEFKNEKGELPVKAGFKSSGGTSVLRTPNAGITITCTAEKGSGKITGASTVGKVTVTYTGCTAGACGSAQSGTTAGEIKTSALKGHLGEISSGSGVGQLLEPESGSTFVSVKFEKESFSCLGSSVSGSVIGEATPVKTLSTEGKLIFAESGGHQAITSFTGEEANHHLSAFGFESTLEGQETIKFEEKVEVT